MSNFWKTVLAVITGIALLGAFLYFVVFVLLIGGMVSLLNKAGKTLPSEYALTVDFRDMALCEQSAAMPEFNFAALASGVQVDQVAILDATLALRKAAEDPAVKYLILKPDAVGGGLAHLEEFRKALENFRASGKAIIAWTENPGNGSYYLASVADKIYMTSSEGGLTTLLGLSTQITYLKDVLDKLGVNVQLIRHGKFKSAGEMYIRNSISEENRLQYETLLGTVWGGWCEQIARSRGISPEAFNALIDDLKLNSPADFLKAGLVDETLDREQWEQKICVNSGVEKFKDANFVSLADYISARSSLNLKAKNKLAIIYADGEIIDGDELMEVAGDRFVREIRKVRSDKDVKAVVFRVNSPGGSVLASDKIRNEIELLRAEKPVVASYGNYAASGGYWISASCDKIFTDKSTLTGSIGVFSIIPDLSGTFKDKLHVNIETVSTNKHGDMLSLTTPLTPEEMNYMQASVENIYTRFTEIVAEGRSLEVSYVDDIAQGRVWAGPDALNIRLVDEIGTLEDAVNYAVAIADTGDTDLSHWQIAAYPKPLTPFEMVIEEYLGGDHSVLAGTPLGSIETAFRDITEADAGKAYARLPYLLNIK